METQKSFIFSNSWRKALTFKKTIASLGLLVVVCGFLFGNSIVKWTWIKPHSHKKIINLNNTNGFSYSQEHSFENDGDAYEYLIGIKTVISDNNGRELGIFSADSCLIENKMMDISELQLAEGKTTSGIFIFSQKSINKIIFNSGISYKFTTTYTYYRKFSIVKTVTTAQSNFTVAFSDILIRLMNNDTLKERTGDLSTPLTE